MTSDEVMGFIGTALEAAAERSITFTETDDLVADRLIDSLDAVRFVFELERLTGVTLPEGDLGRRGLYNVAALAGYIRQHAAK